MKRAEAPHFTTPEANRTPGLNSREPAAAPIGRGSQMLSREAWQALARSLDLTKRQLQIVQAVFDGDTEFCIAQNLRISPHTVHTHIERIHHKLEVHDRVELVLVVLGEFLRLTADRTADLPPICGRRSVGICPLQEKLAGSGRSKPGVP